MDSVLTFDDEHIYRKSRFGRINWTGLPCGCSVSNSLTLRDETGVHIVCRCMEHRNAAYLQLLALVQKADEFKKEAAP